MNDSFRKNLYIKDVIQSAIKACEIFSPCLENFFNFELRHGYLGWENWLTVEIFRNLNSSAVVPFAPYSICKKSLPGLMDLFVRYPNQIVVEIKTNYLDNDELGANSLKLHSRIKDDISKMNKVGNSIYQLLILAIVFESQDGLEKYQNELFDTTQLEVMDMNCKFYTVSSASDHKVLLQAISNADKLFNIEKK